MAGKFDPNRFWARVSKTDTCWIWTGSKTTQGYGMIRVDGQHVYAHRWSYEQANGQIPQGLEMDHLCRNPSCVNPSHLEAVTHRENGIRGNSPCAENARKTHCPHGHSLEDAYIYRARGRTGRMCRTCKLEREARIYWGNSEEYRETKRAYARAHGKAYRAAGRDK